MCSTKHGLNHMDCNCTYTVYSTQHGLNHMHCNCTFTVTLFCVVCITKHGLNHRHWNRTYCTLCSAPSMDWITCTVTVHACTAIKYTIRCILCTVKKLGRGTDRYFCQCWFGEETGGKVWRLLRVNWRYDGGTVTERRVEDWKFSPQLT